jgi:hypothetical protein
VPIFVAAVLKIYPFFALGYGLRPRSRRSLGVLSGAAALLVLYIALTAGDLRAMRLVTERSFVLSYGIETTDLLLRERLGLDANGLRAVLTVTALLILAAAFGATRRLAPVPPDDSRHLDAFRIGAGIFLGTFVLVSSWDYRLMFLFFTVPQLLDWIESERRRRDVRLAAWVSLILVYIVVWKTGNTPVAHLALTWLLFALLGYLFARTLPGSLTAPRAAAVTAGR